MPGSIAGASACAKASAKSSSQEKKKSVTAAYFSKLFFRMKKLLKGNKNLGR